MRDAGCEILGYMIIGLIGFLIGGGVGMYLNHGWFPDAWYGLGIVWGICFAVTSTGNATK